MRCRLLALSGSLDLQLQIKKSEGAAILGLSYLELFVCRFDKRFWFYVYILLFLVDSFNTYLLIISIRLGDVFLYFLGSITLFFCLRNSTSYL